MTSGVAENSVLFGGRVKPEAPTQEIERVWLPTASTLHNSRYKPPKGFAQRFQRHARPCAGHPRRDAVRRLQNFKSFGGGARRERLGPELIVPTWMTGTSPGMTDRALITQAKVLT
jgi:hypothetical protein